MRIRWRLDASFACNWLLNKGIRLRTRRFGRIGPRFANHTPTQPSGWRWPWERWCSAAGRLFSCASFQRWVSWNGTAATWYSSSYTTYPGFRVLIIWVANPRASSNDARARAFRMDSDAVGLNQQIAL